MRNLLLRRAPVIQVFLPYTSITPQMISHDNIKATSKILKHCVHARVIRNFWVLWVFFFLKKICLILKGCQGPGKKRLQKLNKAGWGGEQVVKTNSHFLAQGHKAKLSVSLKKSDEIMLRVWRFRSYYQLKRIIIQSNQKYASYPNYTLCFSTAV